MRPLRSPHRNKLSRVHRKVLKVLKTSARVTRDGSTMSLVDHLRELRYRVMLAAGALLATTLLCFAFSEEIFLWIIQPLHAIPQYKLQVLGLIEMFVTYLKLSVMAGVFLAMPFLLLQVWLFVAPGLYSHEKKWILPFVICGTVFFAGGALFAFYGVMPMGFPYLVAMVPEGVEANYRVSDYVSLVTQLLLAFGLVFQLPLVMWLLAAAGLISPTKFAEWRKYWIVAAFVIGGILTPPDPITQIMMAVPLLLFFELGILGARLIYKKRREGAKGEGL